MALPTLTRGPCEQQPSSLSVKLHEVRDLGLSLWRLQHLEQCLVLKHLLTVLIINKGASASVSKT